MEAKGSRGVLTVAALLAVTGVSLLGYSFNQSGIEVDIWFGRRGGAVAPAPSALSAPQQPPYRRKNSEEEEAEESLAKDPAYVAGILAVAVTFICGYYVEHAHITWMPEAAIALVLGIVVAFLSQLVDAPWIGSMKFDYEFFMTFLLPPIIFEAGYNMNIRAFFDNLGPTTFFAFAGTFASTFVVGGIVWYAGQLGLCYPLGLLASLTFGSLISATDPVTVLAVFQALGVKIDLFSMVFGESVLNDAVAIVLSRTLLSFNMPGEEVDAAAIQAAALSFIIIFVGSMLIGAFFACIASLLYKYLGLRMHKELVNLETSLTFVFPWTAYYLAEALELSGIVAIMMCGIIMALFLRHSLSDEAATITSRVYKVVATIAETYVFVYLGMAVVVFPIFRNCDVRLLIISLLACFVGRLHIYAGSFLTNLGRSERQKISREYMFIMWFSGLRGGVAFAIASQIYESPNFDRRCGGLADVGPLTREQADANGENCTDGLTDSLAVLQTTLLIAAFTIFIFGGAITDVAVEYGVLQSKDPQALIKQRTEEYVGNNDLWARIDRYLTPIFSVGKAHQRVQDRDHVMKVLKDGRSGFNDDVHWYFKQENEWALAGVLERITNVQAKIRGAQHRKTQRMSTMGEESKFVPKAGAAAASDEQLAA